MLIRSLARVGKSISNFFGESPRRSIGLKASALSGWKLYFLELVCNRFNPETSRVMVCGSISYSHEMAQMLQDHGLVEGNNSLPRDYVLERSFVG